MYKWIFASEEHAPVRNLKELRERGEYNCKLGLIKDGEGLGDGSLYRVNWAKKYLHTDSVGLRKKFRRKGHGIHLYIALIACARKLGAKRLYSSTMLNKFSRNMWSVKLKRAGYDVRTVGVCPKACKHCGEKARYYINL